MTVQAWRQNILEDGLDRRLAVAGCPCGVEVAIATAQHRYEPLQQWVRASLAAGVMLHTSQAEHVAAGRSLLETARITTGKDDVRFVLHTLTRFEIEMADTDELYT